MKCHNHYITAIIITLVVLLLISFGMSCCSTFPKSYPEKPQKIEYKSSNKYSDSIVINRHDLDSVINMFNKNLAEIEERNSEVVRQQIDNFGRNISLWLAFIAAICTLLPMASAFYQATNTSKALDELKTKIENEQSEFEKKINGCDGKINEQREKTDKNIKECKDKINDEVVKFEDKINEQRIKTEGIMKECKDKINDEVAKFEDKIKGYEKIVEHSKINILLGTLIQSIRLLCDMEDFRFKEKISLADREYIENLISNIDKLNVETLYIVGKINNNLDKENLAVITCAIVVGYRSLLNLLHVMEAIVPDDKIIRVFANKDVVIIDSRKFVSDIADEQKDKIITMKEAIEDITRLSTKVLEILRDCFNFKNN